MINWMLAVALVLGASTTTGSGPDGPDNQFKEPVRVLADGQGIRVESPGFAAPCWADVDGDGTKDLLVGQFAGGKIRWFKNDGEGKLAKGRWLEAGGEVAKIPGVW